MIDDAIAILEAEVAAFGQGTKDQPAEGTPEFFILRAKSVGLSMLRSMQARGLDSPSRVESFYKATLRSAKIGDVLEQLPLQGAMVEMANAP